MQASFDWRHPVWLALLTALSVGLSLEFACAVPLAAFAALGALTMSRRDALMLVLAIVAANQCVGFAFLHYPASSWPWAAAFGFAGVLAVFAAGWARRVGYHPAAVSTCAFLAAFAAYEGGLCLITLASRSGDLAPYAATAVLRIFIINAATFAGLLLATRIAAGIGFVRPALAPRAGRLA
ncbi:MAG TPA: hypothetical protein VKV77_00540 [Methylovirgula sp.]|nr:hypothetical protein [Methylovirgula sp.]